MSRWDISFDQLRTEHTMTLRLSSRSDVSEALNQIKAHIAHDIPVPFGSVVQPILGPDPCYGRFADVWKPILLLPGSGLPSPAGRSSEFLPR